MNGSDFAVSAEPTNSSPWTTTQHCVDEWITKRRRGSEKAPTFHTTAALIAAVESLPTDTSYSQSAKLPDWPLVLEDEQRSLIVGEIFEYPKLQAGWDGSPDDIAPSSAAADQAATFVELLPPFVPVPEPSVAADGEVILYWREPDLYIEVGFRGGETFSYFAQRGIEKIKGPGRVDEMFSSADKLATFLIKAFSNGAMHV